ncbi:hypothetical protein C1645_833707 [Glomus cerebriforme]|uniref:RNase H type-1 domain-containing protein n=1 Tax=Glomus cerebriforme TaxID=658196 RepID=A0A397SL35_9GLOM|nr:hypothetical protein C1645_833707 [Glomus cerebriforme]
MAILTAIITCPKSANITIHTDSQCCISTFNRIMDPLTPLRRLQKIPNFLIWQAIKYIIRSNAISLDLRKVKAHSNDLYNDAADALAKEGASSPTAIYLNFKHIPNQKATLTWMNLGPLERPVRKWTTDVISCKSFNRFINSSNISSLMSKCQAVPIDFSITQLWINYNPFVSITSNELSSYISYKIKSMNSLLPTCDLLQRNYPHVYPKTPISCPSCNLSTDSNDHIILCSIYSPIIVDLLFTHESMLTQFLYDKQPTPHKIPRDNIQTWISLTPIFAANRSVPVSDNLDLILISHQFIPKSFDDLFMKIFPKKKPRRAHLIDFLHFLLMDLRKITWLAHCDARAEWEKSLNISQCCKRPRQRTSSRQSASNSRVTQIHRTDTPSTTQNVYASSLWLIWASSNFLHSGSWTHHRSITLHYNIFFDFISFINSFNIDVIRHPLLLHDAVPSFILG